MKAGIFGGTFDPIHLGHLIIAEEARCRFKLDKIIFVPAGQPWMKADRTITSGEHRLAMLRISTASNPYFEISSVELERTGPTYTVDTLEQLWKELGYTSQLYLLLGWDSLKDLPKWKAPLRISRMATLVAFPRPGYEKPDVTKLESEVPGLTEKLVMQDGPYIGISSTCIRQKIADGHSIRYKVPEAVAQYITDHRLYESS